MAEGNKPERKYKSGLVELTIWKNEFKGKDGDDFETKSFDLKRNYKDKDGKWASTTSMKEADVPRAIALLQKAYADATIKD